MTTPSGARHEDDYWRRPPEETGPAAPTPGEAAPPPGRGAESNMPGNDGPDTSGSHAPGRDSHAPGGPGPEVAQLADPANNDRARQAADLPPPSSSTDGPATSGEGHEKEVLSATAPATWSPWAAPADVPPPAGSVTPPASGGGTAYHGPPPTTPPPPGWRPPVHFQATPPRTLPPQDMEAMDAAEQHAQRLTYAVGAAAGVVLLLLLCLLCSRAIL